jgi:small subunit ribosomal protein S4e
MATPKNWPLARKGKKIYVSAGKGTSSLSASLPLVVVLRDMLNLVATARETKKVLNKGEILVDNRVVKEPNFRVGLFDQIYVKPLDKAFTLELENNKLKVTELNKESIDKKIVKVVGKRTLKKGKAQISLYDGKSFMLSDSEAGRIKVGDSVIIDLKENKIKGNLKLEKGALALVVKGAHQGEKGKIISIEDQITIENTKKFKVSKQNIFITEK